MAKKLMVDLQRAGFETAQAEILADTMIETRALSIKDRLEAIDEQEDVSRVMEDLTDSLTTSLEMVHQVRRLAVLALGGAIIALAVAVIALICSARRLELQGRATIGHDDSRWVPVRL